MWHCQVIFLKYTVMFSRFSCQLLVVCLLQDIKGLLQLNMDFLLYHFVV
jgi:hypothetical protein